MGAAVLEDLHFVNDQTGWLIEGDQSKVFRTDDGGHTWVEQYQYPDPDNSLFFDVFFVDDTHGWIAAHSGRVVRTTDGGQTWEVSTPGEGQNLHSAFFHDAERGWVVGDNGTVLRTADGGASWTSVSLGPRRLQSGGFQRPLARVLARSQRLVPIHTGWGHHLGHGAIGDALGCDGCDLRRRPGWVSWWTKRAVYMGRWMRDCRGRRLAPRLKSDPQVLHFSSASTGWLSGGDGTWVTHNGGVDWEACGLGGGLSSIHSVSENEAWVSNGDGQAFATRDAGDTWEVLSFTSIGGVQVQGDDVWATGSGWLLGLIHSSDAGQTWYLMPGQIDSVHFVTDQVAYGLDIDYPGQELHLVRTEDGGSTFLGVVYGDELVRWRDLLLVCG